MALPPSHAAATGTTVLRRYQDLPGPLGVPLLGSALQIDKQRYHQQLEAWAARYGPVFRLRLGPRRLLVLSDHALVAAVLRQRPEVFSRPPRHGDIVREMGLERGLLFVNGETWQRQRRMVMAALDPAHVRAFLPSLVRVAQRLRTRWQAAADAANTIDLQADLMRYTVDAVAGLAFGADVNSLEHEEDAIQRHLNQIFPAIGRRATAALPTWRYVRPPADRALERSVIQLRRAIDGFIAAARQRLASDPPPEGRPRHLLEAMLMAANDGEGGLNEADVAGNVLVMLLAGEDTTASTLSWTLDFLHRHPAALERAAREVKDVVPDLAACTPERLDALPYLEACVQESMRLKPVAPLLPAQANQDTVIGDVAVPAGTIVVSLLRPDATNERHFDRPHHFVPERWLDGSAAGVHASARVAMPFGAGPRLCPGRYLALVEMKVALAMTLASFRIEHVGTADTKPARERLAVAMAPVGLRMRLARAEARTPTA